MVRLVINSDDECKQIVSCNVVALCGSPSIPNITLKNSEFLAFEFNTPDIFIVPILGYFHISIYHLIDGYRIGVGGFREINGFTVRLCKCSLYYSEQSKMLFNIEYIDGEWSAKFDFLHRDIDNCKDEELLFIMDSKDIHVDHTNIAFRLLYPDERCFTAQYCYGDNLFIKNKDLLIRGYVMNAKFTITPDIFLIAIMKRYSEQT
jgi:hypothetical protein